MGSQQSKIVGLDKVLGIGGEGVVIEKELEITVMERTEDYDYEDKGWAVALHKKAENTRLITKEKKIVALKFVKFEKDKENFTGQGFNIQVYYITNMLSSQAVGDRYCLGGRKGLVSPIWFFSLLDRIVFARQQQDLLGSWNRSDV